MQCRDARELLDSFLAEELLVETNHELLRHLSGCPDCQADLDARARMRSGLKQAFARAGDLQIRPEFVDRLAAELRTTALTGRRGWQTGWLMAAASIVLVVAAGVYFLRRPAADIAASAAGDHQNCAVKFALTERPISARGSGDALRPRVLASSHDAARRGRDERRHVARRRPPFLCISEPALRACGIPDRPAPRVGAHDA